MEIKNEFDRLVTSINLTQEEDYDCTLSNVWSYRKSTDFRDGIILKFGNMCNGFPFEIEGTHFFNSESAYVAGAYANDNQECIHIQNLISNEVNGQKCKRVYRRLPEYTQHMRKDFYTYNVQWMLFVLWQKCQQNSEFASLLKWIPIDAHIIENTSYHNGDTATFWGAMNKEQMAARERIEDEVAKNQTFKYKYQLSHAQMLASNTINNIGSFVGTNVMGKIIKLCSLSLIYNQTPPIDYELLEEKKLFMLGTPLKF